MFNRLTLILYFRFIWGCKSRSIFLLFQINLNFFLFVEILFGFKLLYFGFIWGCKGRSIFLVFQINLNFFLFIEILFGFKLFFFCFLLFGVAKVEVFFWYSKLI
ncbi:MAG: hypothetical protein EAZ70_07815 [Runella slithyformis]|nr:MAG: hypothetical protein EAY79_07235 [Runella slithyformis]TAF27154.1 MAG: hypothetical protein EAZ70_07815 [Runella slithyformis]TAF45593.1 MAG: hypothetical protein EAZ63_10810 [Runella slithyformis]TAF82673.1 MAG: hypothetical protein EAZ50_03530 [Runella slithyformis]